jgi:hypothetical protein
MGVNYGSFSSYIKISYVDDDNGFNEYTNIYNRGIFF